MKVGVASEMMGFSQGILLIIQGDSQDRFTADGKSAIGRATEELKSRRGLGQMWELLKDDPMPSRDWTHKVPSTNFGS